MKVAFEFAGFVFTVKEVVALVVGTVVFLGSLFGLAWTEGAVYAGLLAVTMAVGAGVAVFVALMVITEKWVASSPPPPVNVTEGDVTIPITGVEARAEAGSVSPNITGTVASSQPPPSVSGTGITTPPSTGRDVAMGFLTTFGPILDADPAQIAEYRRVYMKDLAATVSSTATLETKVIRAQQNTPPALGSGPVVVTPAPAQLHIDRTPMQQLRFAINRTPLMRRYRRWRKWLKHGLQ